MLSATNVTCSIAASVYTRLAPVLVVQAPSAEDTTPAAQIAAALSDQGP